MAAINLSHRIYRPEIAEGSQLRSPLSINKNLGIGIITTDCMVVFSSKKSTFIRKKENMIFILILDDYRMKLGIRQNLR